MTDRIAELGLLAVLRGASARDAVEVADALVEGGVLGIEVTFTTPDAPAAIRELADRHGDAIVLGAGTVTAPAQAAEAAEAGAGFLVSPGLDPELLPAMRETGLPVLPGVLTPSEVMLAMRLEVPVVKLFPGAIGGPAHLSALRAPFPEMGFLPTGGVSADNVEAWFAAGALAVGVGGALAPASLEDRPALVERARALVGAVAQARAA
jgi:2-dehydro-3-deoxyphosphogluconate aldolase/(4S)-4-hydroxy-2-oxoglutarate aldolase